MPPRSKAQPDWEAIDKAQRANIASAKKAYAKRTGEYNRVANKNFLFSEGLPSALAKGDLHYLRKAQTTTPKMPDEALGDNLSEQWRMHKRISEMEESGEPLIDQAELLPYNERPAYSVGEHLVKKAPFRPSKRQMDKYRKGRISYEELMRPERILKGATDILSPQDAKGVAEVAVLGTALKGVKAAYVGGKRLMTNIPMPESYDITRKLNAIINAPLKNKLYAMKYDVPVSPSVPLGTKSTRLDRLGRQLKGTVDTNLHNRYLDKNDRGDLGFIAHELNSLSARRGAAKRLMDIAPNEADRKKQKAMLDKIEFEHFISIQDYFLRRGLKMPSTPEGFNNPKFLEMFPEYKPVAKEWKRMMANIMEYEMKDPKTGKMIPYASFKKLPYDLKNSLIQSGYGSSTTRGYGPFGGYSVGKTARQVPGMPKGMKEERMFYKDVSDFNAPLGASLKNALDHLRTNWHPLKKGDWGPEKQRSFMNILHDKTGANYGASYGGDILRSVVDKMLKPVTWQGEYAIGTMGAKYNYPLSMGKSGQASRTKRVFTPKTMYKIRGESGFGMKKSAVDGGFLWSDKEMIEWSLKNPNSSGYLKGGYDRMSLSKDKSGNFRLLDWVKPSKKEAKWSQDIMDFEKALEGYGYTGVKRFGHKVPKEYKR